MPRSYGSMSYALLKGYLFAGLAKDDPRVQAVWKWLRENYTLDVNPGFQASDDPTASYQGLFYYFYTMAAFSLIHEPSARCIAIRRPASSLRQSWLAPAASTIALSPKRSSALAMV